ncbi:MAG: hypothetical protein JWO80_870 [Bryobacterales bacterium]|nr:hypothetical protein [Bryobacterales bacterium]
MTSSLSAETQEKLLSRGFSRRHFARIASMIGGCAGRTWPAWPTKVRVTIGSPEEMKRFQTALLKVTA